MNLIIKSFSKKYISILILILINFLFTYKYSSRYFSFPFFISILSSLFYLILLSDFIIIDIKNKVLIKIKYALIALFTLGCIYVFSQINIMDLNVDRWSVITSFWDTYFSGNYPYLAKSHLGNYPGPMPIYFLLALPFYAINELGYFSLFGFFLFVYLIHKSKILPRKKLLFILFLMSSSFFLWEIVSRSNIFTNSMLVVWFLYTYSESKKNNINLLYLSAIIAGLLISTRAVFIIPYIVIFMYSLRKKEITIFNFSVCIMISLLSFSASFLPIILSYPDDFFKMNPFLIQSSFLIPSYYIILFILITLVFSFLTKSKNDTYFFSGLSLFTSILIYFIYHTIKIGIDEAVLGNIIDFSYFIFCIPFLLLYLIKTQESHIVT